MLLCSYSYIFLVSKTWGKVFEELILQKLTLGNFMHREGS